MHAEIQGGNFRTFHQMPFIIFVNCWHTPFSVPLCSSYITLSSLTNLLRGVRVDKLTVDDAGLGLGGRNPVVLTGQPEPEVLLTEL